MQYAAHVLGLDEKAQMASEKGKIRELKRKLEYADDLKTYRKNTMAAMETMLKKLIAKNKRIRDSHSYFQPIRDLATAYPGF